MVWRFWIKFYCIYSFSLTSWYSWLSLTSFLFHFPQSCSRHNGDRRLEGHDPVPSSPSGWSLSCPRLSPVPSVRPAQETAKTVLTFAISSFRKMQQPALIPSYPVTPFSFTKAQLEDCTSLQCSLLTAEKEEEGTSFKMADSELASLCSVMCHLINGLKGHALTPPSLSRLH